MQQQLKSKKDGISKKWRSSRSIGPFYDGGRVFVSNSILSADDNRVERQSSSTSLVCLHENNIKISNWTSGEFVMKVMEDDIYLHGEEDRDVDAREKVTCFVVHPSKSEVMVGNNLGLLKYYIILSSTYLEEHKRNKTSRIHQPSATMLPDQIDSTTNSGFSLIRTIKAHTMPVLCADIDSTGTLVATGSTDMSVKVWDVRKGHCTHVFKGHTNAIHSLYFSPSYTLSNDNSNDITLVSTSQDNSVKLWSLQDSKCIETYANHLSTPTAVAWCPTDRHLMVSASRDKVMNFYIQSAIDKKKNSMIHTEPVMDELESCMFMTDENAQKILHGNVSSNITKSTTQSKSSGNDGDGKHVLLTAGALGIVYFYEIYFNMANDTTTTNSVKKKGKNAPSVALEYSFSCVPLFKLIASGPLVMYEIAITYSDSPIAQTTSGSKSKSKSKSSKTNINEANGSHTDERLPLSAHWSVSNSPTAYSTSARSGNSADNQEEILMSISQLLMNDEDGEIIVVTSDQTICSYTLSCSTDSDTDTENTRSNVTKLTLSRQLVGNNDDILDITTMPFPAHRNHVIGCTTSGRGSGRSISTYNNIIDAKPSESQQAAASSVFSKVTEAAAQYERKRVQQMHNIYASFFNAIATNSPHLRVMDGRGGCQLLYGHTDVVLSLQGTPDGRYLLSSSKDSTVRLWDLFPSPLSSDNPAPPVCIAVGRGHTEGVGGICISQRESNYTFTSSKSGKHECTMNKAAMLSFSVGADKILKRWNMNKAVSSKHSSDYNRLTYTYTDEDIGSTVDTTTSVKSNTTQSPGSQNNTRITLSTLQVSDPVVLSSTHSVRAHDKDINCVQLSPDDQIVATGSQDKTVKLWQSADLTSVAVLRGHKRGIWKIAFSPVDKCLASSSADRTIKIWSLTDHIVLRSLEGSAASVLTLSYINHGLQLLSGSADGLVRLWKCSNGECITAMDEHKEKVWCISAPSETVLKRINGTNDTSHKDSSKSQRSNDDSDDNDEKETENMDMDIQDTAMNTLTTAMSSSHIDPFFFTGSSDSTIKLWFDQTDELESQRLIELEEKLLTEQSLDNDIRNKRYAKALTLALNLSHGARTRSILQAILDDETSNEKVIFSTFEDMNEDVQAVGTGNVMNQFGDVKDAMGSTFKVIDGNSKFRMHSKAYNADQAVQMIRPENTWSSLFSSPPLQETPLDTSLANQKVYCLTPEIHSQRLDDYITSMTDAHLNKLSTFLLDWNTNAKYALLSQCLIHSMIRVLGVDRMRHIAGMRENVKALIAYTERHYERIKSMHKSTFSLEYMINTMSLSLLGNVDILEGTIENEDKESKHSSHGNVIDSNTGYTQLNLADTLPLMVAGISSNDPRNQLSSVTVLSDQIDNPSSKNKKRKKEESTSNTNHTAVDTAMFLQGDKFSSGTSLSTRVALEVQEAKDAKFHGRTRVNSKKTKKRNDLVVFYSSSDDSDTGDLNEGRNSLAERRASYDTDSDSDDSVPPSSSTGGKGTRIGHKGKEFNRSNEDIFDEINREATEEASSLKAHKGRKSTPSATKQPSSASKGSASSDGRKNEEKASTMDVEANKVNENGKINKKDRKETKEKKEKKKEKTNKRRKK